MNPSKISCAIMALLFAIASISPVWAKKSQPALNDEGMELVKDSALATVYTDPGADLGIYNQIWLEDATVAFKKNWQRDQNRNQPLKIRTSDMEHIQNEVATVFR
jgi:hypothetical protein